MLGANYSGKQPNSSAYVKRYVKGHPQQLWKLSKHNEEGIIEPITPHFSNVLIPGNLYVNGNIINTSDAFLKDNICNIDDTDSINILSLQPRSFTFKKDINNLQHFGFIAQEVETIFPSLVFDKPDSDYKNIKAVNYLELIPLLVHRIQVMAEEIKELKMQVKQTS